MSGRMPRGLRAFTKAAALTAVGAVVSSLLVVVPAAASAAEPEGAAATIGYRAVPASVPVVDSQVGVGALLGPEAEPIDIVPTDDSPSAALVRLTSLQPEAASTISLGGAVALNVGSGALASTTVLVPVSPDGTVSAAATTPTDVRIEPLAFFDEPVALPGAVTALEAPVRRTPDGGVVLGSSASAVGVVGLGGVPSTAVRSVFVSVEFGVATASADTVTVDLGGVELPVREGTIVSTFVSPNADGDILLAGPAGLTADVVVRGWVAEAAQSEDLDDAATPVNTEGGFVPAFAPVQHVALVDGTPAAIDRGRVAPSDDALVLVWADGATAQTAITAGTDTRGRATGAVVDAARGAEPQLLLVNEVDSAVAIDRGRATANIAVVGAVVGGAAKADDFSVTFRDPGAQVDLGETGGTVELRGTIDIVGGDLASVQVSADDTVLGDAAIRYTRDGIHWSLRTAAPATGTYEFTVVATDRSGVSVSAVRTTRIELPAADETVIVDNVQIFDDPSALVVAALTDETVTVLCDLAVGPGDYIVASTIPGAPSGFLRQIVAKDVTPQGTVLHTQIALLTDVFIQLDVQEDAVLGGPGTIIEELHDDPYVVEPGDLPVAWASEAEFDTSDLPEVTDGGSIASVGAAADVGTRTPGIAPALYTAAGSRAHPAALEGGTSFEPSVTTSAKLGVMPDGELSDGSKSGGSGARSKVKLEGGVYLEADVTAKARLAISIKIWVEFNWLKSAIHSTFENSFTLSTESKTAMAFYLEATKKGAFATSFDKRLATAKLPNIYIPAGPIIIPVVPSLSLSTAGEVKVTASLEFSTTVKWEQTSGTKCTDGKCEPIGQPAKATASQPKIFSHDEKAELSGSIEASVGPKIAASALLWGVAGVEASFTMGLGASVKLAADSTGTVGVEGELFAKFGWGLAAKVVVPLSIIKLPGGDITLLDWRMVGANVRVSILKISLSLDVTPDPAPTPTTPSGPSTGTSGPAPGGSGSGGSGGSGGGSDGGTRDAIDVMFVIDTTGSMSGYISATVAKARDIAARLGSSARSARVGLVEYRDSGDAFTARTVVPLTSDLSALGRGLDGLYADGGGDWEEAVYSGVVTALNEDWRPSAARAIIVMGDAPAHDPEYETGYTAAQVGRFLAGTERICQNARGGITGGPSLPGCTSTPLSSYRFDVGAGLFQAASFGAVSHTVLPQRAVAPALTVAADTGAGLPVILYGISADSTLSAQLAPIAEASGGTVADINGSDAVGDAIDEALASVGRAPEAYFTWELDGRGLTVDATGSAFEGDAATFVVDFGDGTESLSSPTETHVFASPGEYTVTVTVTDEAGRSGQASVTLQVGLDESAPWTSLAFTVDSGTFQPGENAAVTVVGLEPGDRVVGSWAGASDVATAVAGADGQAVVVLGVPWDAAVGDLGFEITSPDARRSGTGTVAVGAFSRYCVAA